MTVTVDVMALLAAVSSRSSRVAPDLAAVTGTPVRASWQAPRSYDEQHPVAPSRRPLRRGLSQRG